MKIVYCKEWGLFLKKPHDVISEQFAREMHIQQKPYVAVIYENDIVKYVVEIDEVSETIRFYDENLNNYLVYIFIKKEDHMFLKTSCYYSFDNEKKVEHIHFNFEETGDMITEKRNYTNNTVVESKGRVDVSCNWECIPMFGEYESVIRIERE